MDFHANNPSFPLFYLINKRFCLSKCIIFSLLTARYLDAILTSFPGLPARISFFVPEPVAITRAAISMFIAGVVAAAYPAWLAARSPIALTLRSNAE